MFSDFPLKPAILAAALSAMRRIAWLFAAVGIALVCVATAPPLAPVSAIGWRWLIAGLTATGAVSWARARNACERVELPAW